MNNITQQIRSTLFEDQDIWKDKTNLDKGYPHTNLTEELVAWAVSDRNHIFWLEIGSMLGGSALLAANIIKNNLRKNVDIVCIDPFTGDVNMWDWEKGLSEQNKWKFLSLKNGGPTIRQRFLANVFDSGFHYMITPIQATSIVGMKLLKRLYETQRILKLPDIIYVDSAHEKDETFLELKTAWSILAENGVLIGDDLNWTAVKEDVYSFAKSINKQVDNFSCNQWGIKK